MGLIPHMSVEGVSYKTERNLQPITTPFTNATIILCPEQNFDVRI